MLWTSEHCVGAEESHQNCKTGESGVKNSQRAPATLQAREHSLDVPLVSRKPTSYCSPPRSNATSETVHSLIYQLLEALKEIYGFYSDWI